MPKGWGPRVLPPKGKLSSISNNHEKTVVTKVFVV